VLGCCLELEEIPLILSRLTGGHSGGELTFAVCGGCTSGRETGENAGDNAGKNGTEKATNEDERAEIDMVNM
jgi:hypothetical protein